MLFIEKALRKYRVRNDKNTGEEGTEIRSGIKITNGREW